MYSTMQGHFSSLFFSFLIPQCSEGLHSVSSRDNGVPSVTTVRITEHNRGRAAVMPAQGKPTGSSCSRLSSDESRVFQVTCDLLPAATSAYFAHVAPRGEQQSVFCFFSNWMINNWVEKIFSIVFLSSSHLTQFCCWCLSLEQIVPDAIRLSLSRAVWYLP